MTAPEQLGLWDEQPRHDPPAGVRTGLSRARDLRLVPDAGWPVPRMPSRQVGLAWRLDAACKTDGPSPVDMFPDAVGDEPPRRVDWTLQRAVCGGCPVVRECLGLALDQWSEWGMSGGLTPGERNTLARSMGLERPVEHGTNAGYFAGCRDACCKGAHAAYERQARATRSAARNGRPAPVVELPARPGLPDLREPEDEAELLDLLAELDLMEAEDSR